MSKRKLDVICDDCKKEFRIRKIKNKKHRDALEGVLTIEYFICPNCKKKYVTFISNSDLRKAVKERQRIYSSIRTLDVTTNRGEREATKRMKQIEEMDSKIRLRVDSLKFHFSKYA